MSYRYIKYKKKPSKSLKTKSLKSRITKAKNQLYTLRSSLPFIKKEDEEFLIKKENEVKFNQETINRYKSEIEKIKSNSDNFSQNLFFRIGILKPKLTKKHSEFVKELNEKIADLRIKQKLVKTSKLEGDWTEKVDNILNPGRNYSFNSLMYGGYSDYFSIEKAIKNKIKDLEAQLILDEEEMQKRNDEVEKLRSFKAAYLGETRQLGSNLKNRLLKTKKCPYCGLDIGGNCQADHIYPVSKGGLSTPRNMVYVCYDCNQKKRDLTLTQFIEKYKLDRSKIWSILDLLGKDY